MESIYHDYENTIYRLANQYREMDGIFKLSEKQIEDLAIFLCVDSKKMQLSLGVDSNFEIDINHTYLFQIFIRVFITWEYSKEIHENIKNEKYENILILVEKIREMFLSVEGLNVDIATFMCFKGEKFTRSYALQDWKDHSMFSWFKILWCCNEPSFHRELIPFIVNFIIHDVMSRMYSIYLTGVMLVIQDSPYIDLGIKKIAADLYQYFLEVLRNSKLIGIQFNSLHPHTDAENRGKKDNTTQLQLIYSYNNFDAYCLRLDLPHKGQKDIHFNNRTPGERLGNEVNSCIFQESEYETILSNNPKAKKFFIQYNNVYALKERCNCEFEGTEDQKLFEKIENDYSHFKITSKEYDETDIIKFVELLGYFFPRAPKTIDIEYEYAMTCFNYNKLEEQLNQLIYMQLHSESPKMNCAIQKKIDIIIEYLENYKNLDLKGDLQEFCSMEGIYMLLDYLEETIQKK